MADSRMPLSVHRRMVPRTSESHEVLCDQMQDLTNAIQQFIMPKSRQGCIRLPDYSSCPIPAEPTHVQLDCVSSHNNTLSLITLIEASLLGLTWKEYTSEHMKLFRKALIVISQESPITYKDYQNMREDFREAGIKTSPRLERDTLKEEEWDDGEEE